MCSFQRHWRIRIQDRKVVLFFHFATHPVSGERVTIYGKSLFKTSPGVQISYCSIIINVQKKETGFLPYECKPVLFRWMIIKPLGVAGNGPLSPLIQGNTNKYQLHRNAEKGIHTIPETKMK